MTKMKRLINRYIELFGDEHCHNSILTVVEEKLGLKLPEDFKDISQFYSGGILGGISHYEIHTKSEATNIVSETIKLRNSINLDDNYVVLAEPPESLIVLDVSNPAVIWCDAVEVRNINTQNFINKPDTWQNYADFFEYLLDEEYDE